MFMFFNALYCTFYFNQEYKSLVIFIKFNSSFGREKSEMFIAFIHSLSNKMECFLSLWHFFYVIHV